MPRLGSDVNPTDVSQVRADACGGRLARRGTRPRSASPRSGRRSGRPSPDVPEPPPRCATGTSVCTKTIASALRSYCRNEKRPILDELESACLDVVRDRLVRADWGADPDARLDRVRRWIAGRERLVERFIQLVVALLSLALVHERILAYRRGRRAFAARRSRRAARRPADRGY